MSIIEAVGDEIKELRSLIEPVQIEVEWRNKRRRLIFKIGDTQIGDTPFMVSLDLMYWIKGYLTRVGQERLERVYRETPVEKSAEYLAERSLKMITYQVVEDNAGGMYLFFFNGGEVILGLENIEYAQTGDLDNITYEEAATWDSKLENPQDHYDNLTSYEFGWSVVADQDGVYPNTMGRAAQIVYGVDDD